MAPKKNQQKQKASSSSSKGKPAPSTAPKLQLSAENENRLRRLLLNSGRSAPSSAPSDESLSKEKTAKRLRSVYEKLSCDGFKDDQIELALSTLKESSTYEAALDWLCLNIPGNELPLKFSSGSSLHTSGGSVGVISTAREDWISSRDSPAYIIEEKAEIPLKIKERKDDKRLDPVQRSQADWIHQYMEQQEEDESDSWETYSMDNDVSKKVLESRSNYESIVEDYHAARLQAANAKDRGDKKSQNEAGLIIRKLKQEISALGLSVDILESGYVSSSRRASYDVASNPVPSDNSDGDMVNVCNIEGDTACTEFRVEVDEKEVGCSGSHDHLTDTASLSIPMRNGDSLERESGDIELGDFFVEDSGTSNQILPPEILELQKKEKLKALCSEKNIEKMEGIWKKVRTTIHEAHHGDPKKIPKAVLHQLCQKSGWEAPKYDKVLGEGQNSGYSISILRKASGRGKNRKAGGLTTIQLPSQDESFNTPEDSQNRVAAYALHCLFPDIPVQLALLDPYSSMVLKWKEGCRASDDDDSHSRGDGLSEADDHDNYHGEDNYGESDDSREIVEESDSSEDEVAPRNTIGNVPLEWYGDEEHIGYDLAGKKIKKKERQSKLDSFLASSDDSKNWRKIYDEYNDEEVELTKKETKLIGRLLKGKAPHADFDPYAPYVDWFVWDGAKHPLSNAPEPKRRFIPSKWESKMVLRYVRAIRAGLIKLDAKPKEEPQLRDLWDDSSSAERQGLAYIPAPKSKLPGHEESYNPSPEYIPTQEEINSYQLMFEEDRPKFIPKQFTSLRRVPAYEKAVQETFDRCLDLYLCPRVRKKRINIDPETLKPKLPSRKDLKPYPTNCYLEYRGHKGPVTTISTEPTGQWIASGSKDGTVRIWEVETGRCLQIWDLGENIEEVAWNPLPEIPMLAVAAGQDVFILNTRCGSDEQQKKIEDLLHVEPQKAIEESDISASIVNWGQDDRHGGIRLKHFKTVTKVEWHRKGDYLSTLMPSGESRSVMIHQLSKRLTQRIPFKTKGIPVSTAFHPTRSIFFTATKKNIRVYDLLKQKLMKKLDAGVREISSIAIHPSGDNVIVGSKDGKLCWFDMDLSSRPYRVLRCHPKDITGVAYHHSYPLFASCSDDCTAYVFHGTVYSDLNQNPLIVPLEILRGHSSADGRGVLDCKFHPRQPWLFTAGADSLIKLYCH